MTKVGFLVKQYAMTRPHLIARLILAAMGVYLLMRFLNSIYSAVWNLNLKCSPETPTWGMLVITAGLVITLTASLILLFRSDWLARLMVGTDASQYEKVDSRWIITGFRMIACLCGLLILYWPVSQLVASVPVIGSNILSYMTFEGQSSLLSTKTLVRILSEVIKGVFAIYLLFGAPHYVRRQMRTMAVK